VSSTFYYQTLTELRLFNDHEIIYIKCSIKIIGIELAYISIGISYSLKQLFEERGQQ